MNHPENLVKHLLKSRRHHLLLIKEIEDELVDLSKKHNIVITLDD